MKIDEQEPEFSEDDAKILANAGFVTVQLLETVQQYCCLEHPNCIDHNIKIVAASMGMLIHALEKISNHFRLFDR